MISATIRRVDGRICGFVVEDHGESKTCAAVSLLTLNTVNSIEALTDADFSYDYDPDGGFLRFEIAGADSGADLLLEAMALGLNSVKEEYSGEINITEELI